MPPTHITVTAPPGKLTPIHYEDSTEPGGLPLRVSAGNVHRVRYSQAVRRSIARGDLIEIADDVPDQTPMVQRKTSSKVNP